MRALDRRAYIDRSILLKAFERLLTAIPASSFAILTGTNTQKVRGKGMADARRTDGSCSAADYLAW
jgi:hypothetical protein